MSDWRNRIVDHGEEAPDQLLANPNNWRVHPKAQQEALRGVLDSIGLVSEVVVNRITGHLVDGHLRVALALETDQRSIPVKYVELSEEEERAVLITLDPIAAMAATDHEKVRELLESITEGEAGLMEALMRVARGAGLGARQASEDESAATHPTADPVTRTGDIWRLGRHVLGCGDATDAAFIGRLLGDVTPPLMVTDPPYGVEYDPMWRQDAGVNKTWQRTSAGKVSNDERPDWREAWELFPGAVAYVWHGGTHGPEVAESLRAARFELRSQIIWVKQALVIGRGHYHWQHEPCWYAVRKSAQARWHGDRRQSTVWMISNTHPIQGDADDQRTAHGTQKPVECMQRPMINHTKTGDAVYDPFVGSGTTIIAAEQIGRRAIACDVDPAYADMAIERWQALTSEAATLDGLTFEEAREERHG